jgi:hypothetical protein
MLWLLPNGASLADLGLLLLIACAFCARPWIVLVLQHLQRTPIAAWQAEEIQQLTHPPLAAIFLQPLLLLWASSAYDITMHAGVASVLYCPSILLPSAFSTLLRGTEAGRATHCLCTGCQALLHTLSVKPSVLLRTLLLTVILTLILTDWAPDVDSV